MKTTIGVLEALLLMFLAVAGYGSDKGVKIEGRLNCPVIAHYGGRVYLQIAVTTPAAERRDRAPVNLTVVLDRSGSMADEGKMEYAKQAVRTLIDQLQEDDFFSFVIYDDVVDVVREARRVGAKGDLKRLLDEVFPRGATNLSGGLQEGLRQAERERGKEFVNRVILISDGLANRGITDSHELQRIAGRYRSRSISVTTMGVGMDYNENLMMGLSRSGGGNYYFIENPRSLASVFRKELEEFCSVAAQNASIELTLAEGVRVHDVIGCDHESRSGRVTIGLGDLYSGERRELTVELDVPPGAGTLRLVKGTLRYDGKLGWFESWPSFTATIRYTRDFAEIDRNRNGDVQARADVAVSTRNVEKALEELDKGRRNDAIGAIQNAQASLSASLSTASGAGASAIKVQKEKLEAFVKILSDSTDVRRAKKTIQFENYRSQKQ